MQYNINLVRNFMWPNISNFRDFVEEAQLAKVFGKLDKNVLFKNNHSDGQKNNFHKNYHPNVRRNTTLYALFFKKKFYT